MEWGLDLGTYYLQSLHTTNESHGMGVDETVWADVLRAHEDTAEPAAQFCRRLGVSESAYYQRRKREGWPARTTAKTRTRCQHTVVQSMVAQTQRSKPPGDSTTPETVQGLVYPNSGDPEKTVRGAAPKRLTERLYAAIDQELQQLEAGAQDAPAKSVADIERRTRTLMNMIRGLEKVLELDTDKQKTKGGRSNRGPGQRAKHQDTSVHDTGVSADDAERMRQDIAERLERLHAQWADTSGSGGA